MRIILLCAIVVVGLTIRLAGFHWGQGYNYFSIRSEIRAYEVALDYLRGEPTAQYIGQPLFNDGHVPGPLWAMLCALPLRLGGGVDAVIVFIILLNAVTIVVVYWLAQNLLGLRYSLWAALFWAVLPTSILSSVGVVNPFPLVLFAALLYLALWDVTQRDRSRWIWAVIFLLGVMPQFHMIGLFSIPAVLLILWLSPRAIHKAWLLLGIAGAAALYTPYLWGEMHNGWANTHKIFAHRSWGYSLGVLKIFTVPAAELSDIIARILGTSFEDYRRFGDAMFLSCGLLFALNALSVVFALVVLSDFLLDAGRRCKTHWPSLPRAFVDSPAVVFCVVFLTVPSVMFFFTKHGYNARYALVQLPILILLPAKFVVDCVYSCRWPKLGLTGLTVVLASGVWITLACYWYEGQRIARADYFLPSFDKMEIVYRQLTATVDSGTFAHVDVASLPRDRASVEPARGRECLAYYINLRERIRHQAIPASRHEYYLLSTATPSCDLAQPIIYSGNGITLCKAETGIGRLPAQRSDEFDKTE